MENVDERSDNYAVEVNIRVSDPMVNPLSAIVRPLENIWFIQIWQTQY